MAQRSWHHRISHSTVFLRVFLSIAFVGGLLLLGYGASTFSNISSNLTAKEFSISYNIIRNVHRGGQKEAQVSSDSLPNAELASYASFDAFSLSPPACTDSTWPLLLLFIFTRPDSFVRRRTIRQTYGSLTGGNCTSDVRLLFAVGRVENRNVQRLLEEESREFNDIVQSTAFLDSYGQATRKGVALVHWSLLNCPKATFTAKADDDCFLNLPLLTQILRRNLEEKKVFGLLWANGANVIRDPKNKWAVPRADFLPDRFPPYVSGILYLFHRDILQRIAKAAAESTYLWHDDVFLTGIAPRKAEVGHLDISRFGMYDLTGAHWQRQCAKKDFLAIHYMDDLKMQQLWNDSCHKYVMTSSC